MSVLENEKNKKQTGTGDLKPVLFAFPYAGGTALSYMNWVLPEEIRFIPLDYRGHGLRSKLEFAESIQEIADDAAELICSKLEKGQAFSIFAHSMGGIVAWYTIRILKERYHREPDFYFPSCSAVPADFPPDTHTFGSDEIVMDYLKTSMRMPEKTIKNPRFQKLFLPAILHDFKMIREYRNTDSGEKLSFPIYAFASEEDDLVTPSMAEKWETMTEGEFSLMKMEGGHFYFEDPERRKKLLEHISGKCLINYL